ncbi:glycosyltransferase family 4 protein [Actinoplanes sp. NPDC051513]|uniref:glycosyltransferase family 4 protein n=1 Tax=Actinoplanes sp. NPDC051513 TaxID=3363908 RepID=UPI0037A4E47E
MSNPLWAVLPGSIDDPAAPSGGNRFDRIVLNLLAGVTTPQAGSAGFPTRPVYEIAVDGTWPTPGEPAREALAHALSDIPDASDVLLDGLVACGVPEILAPHKKRLRLIVLVHLPLSDETGLTPEQQTDRRARERLSLHLASLVIATSNAAAARISEMHDLSPTCGDGEPRTRWDGEPRTGGHGEPRTRGHGEPRTRGHGEPRTSRIAVIEPGVAPAEPANADESGSRLLCVASVTPRKGQDLLVPALEKGLADLRWTCTFAGAIGKPVPHASDDIHFVGPLQGTALDAAYASSDLFVLPSRAETYGMVITEALARGLPVIAAEVGGVPEALGRAPDGTLPGILVPPDDPRALADALRAWLTDPGLRERLRAAAAQRRQTLPTWDDTARRLSEVLDS